MDPAVVYEHVVHLEVGLLARVPVGELHEGVLEALLGLPVTDHLALDHLAEPGQEQRSKEKEKEGRNR